MSHFVTNACLVGFSILAAWCAPSPATGQETSRLLPPRSSMPFLLGGPRDPSTSASLLYVGSNPDEHGAGVEAEVAVGTTLPILLLSGSLHEHPVVLGLEAGAFARFGLQLVERELIATDWMFAVPVYWRRDWGWLRFRYYHSSSHMGDEYSRRFDNPGINFSRDAMEIIAFASMGGGVGIYGGARHAYNVHPEEAERWVVRTGAQFDTERSVGPLKPFMAADLEWDQAAGGSRVEVTTGTWLPEVAGRKALRLAIVLLTGPSPLGQFNGLHTFHAGLTLRGNL